MPRERQRRRRREGGWPRGTRPSVTRSGLRAGKTRSARSSGYVKQQVEIGNSVSLRSSTTSTTSSDCGQRSLRLRRTRQQAWTERRGSTTARTLRPTFKISPIDSSEEPTKQGLCAECTSRRWVDRVSFGRSAFPHWKIKSSSVHATVEVLNAICERDFLGFSYGFRTGRSPHQALDALAVGIGTR